MTAKIKLNAASGGGSFSLQAPSSSSNNRVMTLPDSADGTILTTTNPKAIDTHTHSKHTYKHTHTHTNNQHTNNQTNKHTHTRTTNQPTNKSNTQTRLHLFLLI